MYQKPRESTPKVSFTYGNNPMYPITKTQQPNHYHQSVNVPIKLPTSPRSQQVMMKSTTYTTNAPKASNVPNNYYNNVVNNQNNQNNQNTGKIKEKGDGVHTFKIDRQLNDANEQDFKGFCGAIGKNVTYQSEQKTPFC